MMNILGKFKAKLAVGTAVLAMSAVPVIPASMGGIAIVYAAESVNLQVENPGLLPTNPFYFLKSFSRKTQQALTINTIKKVDLELEILNQKAAEIQRLYGIMPDNTDALINALGLYQYNINNLKNLAVKFGSVSRDSNFDNLAVKLVSYSVNHLELFDEMKTAADIQFKEKLNNLQEDLSVIMASAIQVEGADKFANQFLNVLGGLSDDAIKELRAVEIIDYFSQQLPADSSEKQLLVRLKEDLIISAEAIFTASVDAESGLPASLEGLPGDAWRRIKMLDLAREYVKNSALKNDLTLIKQLIMDLSGELRAIGKPEADGLINEAAQLSDLLKKRNEAFKNPFLAGLISRAEFNLEQARESLANGQYVASAGQASAANAALENALGESVFLSVNGLDNEIKKMKTAYDGLASAAKENELSRDNAKDFYSLLSQTEKALAKLSDNKSKKLEITVPAVRNVKLLLAQTRLALDNAVIGRNEK